MRNHLEKDHLHEQNLQFEPASIYYIPLPLMDSKSLALIAVLLLDMHLTEAHNQDLQKIA